MPSMCEHRANSGTMVIGNYLYAFGGFQTQPYGQIGVNTFERLDLTKGDQGAWTLLDFCPGSQNLGRKACFYLTDITSFLKANAALGDEAIERDATGNVEQTIMFIGGWSKTSYLKELDLFYPRKLKLGQGWGGLALQQSDMVTKRPILFQDKLYVLGRQHIHVIDLVRRETHIQTAQGENKALEVAKHARKVFDTLED